MMLYPGDCQKNEKNSNCGPCDNDRYSRVHKQILPLLHSYQKTAVTFFRERMTKQTGNVVLTAEKLFPNVYVINLILQNELSTAKTDGRMRHKGVFRGILFTTGNRGVLYLNPVTQYSAPARTLRVNVDRNISIGILRNVQTSD